MFVRKATSYGDAGLLLPQGSTPSRKLKQSKIEHPYKGSKRVQKITKGSERALVTQLVHKKLV